MWMRSALAKLYHNQLAAPAEEHTLWSMLWWSSYSHASGYTASVDAIVPRWIDYQLHAKRWDDGCRLLEHHCVLARLSADVAGGGHRNSKPCQSHRRTPSKMGRHRIADVGRAPKTLSVDAGLPHCPSCRVHVHVSKSIHLDSSVPTQALSEAHIRLSKTLAPGVSARSPSHLNPTEFE